MGAIRLNNTEPYRVLIVDDLDVNRMIVRDALNKSAYVTTEAENGEQALELIQEREFDVVLLDIMMPGIDGVEVCRRVRNNMEDYLLPIIMVTALDDPEGIGISFQAGANDYIPKPFNKNELEARVRAFAERCRIEKALLESKDYISAIMANMRDGVLTFDDSGKIDTFNPSAVRIFGYESDEIIGNDISCLFTEMSRKELQEYISSKSRKEFSNEKEIGMLELAGRRKDKNIFPVDVLLSDMEIGGKHLFIANLRDITRRKQAEERMAYLANFDDLTGLPNRNLFRDRLGHAIAQAERNEELVALLYIDLDDFKRINDTLGHTVGDELLATVADRLRSCVRESDTVARIGGDEFTVLLEGISEVESATAAAENIINIMKNSMMLDNHEVYVTCSIGITFYPFDTNDTDDLLKDADVAMYRAKDLGKNRYQFYTSDMNSRYLERLLLETGLRRALENNEFILHYQPQLDLASGEINAMEALLRWDHPDKGLLPPNEFIPLLEDTGLIVPVGEYVLRAACKQNMAWQAQGLDGKRISVNLSARQFDDPELIKKIEHILVETGMDPRLLELELTESSLMRDVQSCIEKFKMLDDMGVSIAIDDFGTGYSSLAYLRQFPISTLKIDRSFVKDIDLLEDGLAIPRAIMGMAQALQMHVVAEGVENDTQMRMFAGEACNTIQGYYISRPLPADEITRLLREGCNVTLSPKKNVVI
jgi:diguanylate cyclase (GGDEF)-like protein/PAS domain S-box-containing protein